MNKCLIAFGSNLGDEDLIFEQTTARLSDVAGLSMMATSQPIRTTPVGGPSGQPIYLNAAVAVQTRLNPAELHQALIHIETELGRERRVRWGARKIDLDLLLYGSEHFENETLTIPHPRMSFRRFVLEPAAEIAGEMRHPIADMTIHELLDHLTNMPNEILWVTDTSPATKNLRDQVLNSAASAGWTIHLVGDQECFERLRSQAKLVAWDANRPTSLLQQTFRGPQLQLPALAEKIETELMAAMEAMKPIAVRPR